MYLLSEIMGYYFLADDPWMKTTMGKGSASRSKDLGYVTSAMTMYVEVAMVRKKHTEH